MYNKVAIIFLAIAIFSFLIFPRSVLAQQIGEFANGPMSFNVIIGQNETLSSWTIFNGGNAPLTFNVIPPYFTPIPNRTTPTFNISPMHGIIQPGAHLSFNITIYLSATNNTGGLHWEGIVEAAQVSNQTNVGGASIQAAVAKIINVYSLNPPPPPTTTMPSVVYTPSAGISVELVIIVIVIIVVIVGVAYYITKVRGKKDGMKVAEKEAKKAAKRAEEKRLQKKIDALKAQKKSL